jgi:hypothetical protein
MLKGMTAVNRKMILGTMVILASCCLGLAQNPQLVTNSVPSDDQTSAFINDVRRVVESKRVEELRPLCASSVSSPFHQPALLSYLDLFPTNSFPYSAFMVKLKERSEDDDSLWYPKPTMTLWLVIRTPTCGFELRHPVGLIGSELKFCDRIIQPGGKSPKPPGDQREQGNPKRETSR